VAFGERVTLPLPTTFVVSANASSANEAATVWFAITFVNVTLGTAPADTPSTSTSST
jgi:hypothetical protein